MIVLASPCSASSSSGRVPRHPGVPARGHRLPRDGRERPAGRAGSRSTRPSSPTAGPSRTPPIAAAADRPSYDLVFKHRRRPHGRVAPGGPSVDSLVATYVGGGATEDDGADVTNDLGTWTSWTDTDGDHAWTTEIGDDSVLVYSSGSTRGACAGCLDSLTTDNSPAPSPPWGRRTPRGAQRPRRTPPAARCGSTTAGSRCGNICSALQHRSGRGTASETSGLVFIAPTITRRCRAGLISSATRRCDSAADLGVVVLAVGAQGVAVRQPADRTVGDVLGEVAGAGVRRLAGHGDRLEVDHHLPGRSAGGVGLERAGPPFPRGPQRHPGTG